MLTIDHNSNFSSQMTREDDENFALLVSIFDGEKSDKDISHALHKANGNVTLAIETLLAPISTETKSRNALNLLKDTPIQSQSHATKMLLKSHNVEKHIPCKLFENFLPADLAIKLLQKMLTESENWKTRKFHLFERDVESPHTTCFYMDQDRRPSSSVIPDTDYNKMSSIPGYNSSGNPFFAELSVSRNLIEECVQKELRRRMRHDLESQEEWRANIVVANKYCGSNEGVGAHADRLTYLGPKPTIASLTLGAERIFRIQRIDTTTHPKSFDIALPHNSLLIMFPPMQEEFKHGIPKTLHIKQHDIAKDVRINLTFRVARVEYCESVPMCFCSNPADLRVVSKQTKTKGRYFYLCAARGNEENGLRMGHSCGFFEWLKVPPTKTDVKEK